MLTANATLQPVYTEPSYELVQASSGKRLANYLIDAIFFYLIVIFWAIITATVSPDTIDGIDKTDGILDGFSGRVISLIAYGVIMSLIEIVFGGKSIGKFITGTKAVNEDGTNVSFSTAFVRGFSRAVPFNAFSALGNPCYPWHDKWSNTYVIDEKETRLHNEQLRNN